MSTTEDPMQELTSEQCWQLLEDETFGRLAYRLVDEVHLVPVNYVVDARALLIRTAAGGKLFGAALGTDAAFEIDWHDDLHAWSVVARGHLRRLEEDEAGRVDDHRGISWVPTPKYEVVELVPDTVTGRRFRLQRPESDSELIRS